MEASNQPKYMTIAEVSEMLKVSEAVIENLIEAGKLSAINLGSEVGYRIDSADLEDFLQRQKQEVKETSTFTTGQIHRERKGLATLCSYLREEKTELVKFYGVLNTALENTVNHLNGELESARRSGDQARVNGCTKALKTIFGRWQKTRKSHSDAIFGLETAFPGFRRDEFKMLLAPAEAGQDLVPVKFRRLKEEHAFYEQMAANLEMDVQKLNGHYSQLDKDVTRILKDMKAELRKATKVMDFAGCQIFSDVITMLYREWETARQPYFHWLEEREHRWQECRSRLQAEAEGDVEV